MTTEQQTTPALVRSPVIDTGDTPVVVQLRRDGSTIPVYEVMLPPHSYGARVPLPPEGIIDTGDLYWSISIHPFIALAVAGR